MQFIRSSHKTTVPCDTGLEFRIRRGVKPDDASTPAETGNAKLIGIAAVLFRPCNGGIEVAHNLGIGDFRSDFLKDLIYLHLRYIRHPRIHFGSDSQISGFGKSAADVFDMLVNAEDLLHDQNG